MGLPYRAVLAIACVLFAGRYVFDSDASVTGRWIVGAATAASFVLPDGLAWYITGVVIQLAVVLFVLVRAKASSE